MDWDAFLDTAGRLAAGTTEGDWRSAVSRGYYAVFHYFREWFRSQGTGVGRSGQAHSKLYIGLLNCGVAALQPIARRIDDLCQQRNWADYDLARALTQAVAVAAVGEATDIVADFQAILATTPAATIATGFRTYLQSVGRLPSP